MKRQIEIGRALRKMGFKVTQSTVSRDLKALGIVRREGFYRPPQTRSDQSQIAQMQSFIRRVRSAGPHMIVFETTAGAAKAVAAAPQCRQLARGEGSWLRTRHSSSPPITSMTAGYCSSGCGGPSE